MNIKDEINNLKEDTDKNFNWSIIFTTLILFIYCYFGSFSFFESTFNIVDISYWKIIYHNFMAFVLFFCFGILFTKLVMKEKLSNFNLQLGNTKLGFTLVGIATIIVPICALSTILSQGMVSTYPLVDFAVYNKPWQIALYFLSYIAYYIGWEYLFRGIALKGTQNKISPLGAILFTTLISSLIHTSIASLGKPLIETLSAIPAGLIFGFVSYKTDSIYYSLYMHALVGILTDIFIFVI